MTTERIWRLARGAGNSFTFDDELEWPSKPHLTIPRSIVVLSTLAVGFTLMAVYGDTAVAGTAGSLLALTGLVGVVVMFPTLVTQIIKGGSTDSIFNSQGKDRTRR